MTLFGPLHLGLLVAVAAIAAALAVVVRRFPHRGRAIRIALGAGLALNEIVWYGFRYSHEGVEARNLPLQLCDVTLWATVVACLTLRRAAAEFAYFAGIAGAGMALLTPDLWSPWPSYPAVYFFVVHGGIVAGAAMLAFGRVVAFGPRSMWRAFATLLAYGVVAGVFNAFAGTNHMYLCAKPKNASLLDAFGPWPVYLLPAALVGLAGFWLLSLPLRPVTNAGTAR